MSYDESLGRRAETFQPRDRGVVSRSDERRIREEVEQRRNALRQRILGNDYDVIKACDEDFGCDNAGLFFRNIVGLIGHDEPTKDVAEVRYWLIRKAAEKWLSTYLEIAVDEDAVAREMRKDGAL